MRPFNISISKLATKKTLESLSEVEKETLFGRIGKYDEDKYDLYSCGVAAVFTSGDDGSSTRQRKKKSYDAVDNALFELRANNSILFLGAFPRSIKGSTEDSYDVNSINDSFELSQTGYKFQVSGFLRNLLRRKYRPELMTCLTDDVAQWAMFERFLRIRTGVEVTVLAVVPKDLEEKSRYIKGSAEFRQNGRTIERAYLERIHLPI